MENRKMQLLEAEYRRHLSLMRADPDREKEHREVAEAILCPPSGRARQGRPGSATKIRPIRSSPWGRSPPRPGAYI